MLTTLGLWMAGFALGGASVWRIHHESAATDDDREPAAWNEATPGETQRDATDPENTIIMPVDVIVAGSTPATGAVLMQKP